MAFEHMNRQERKAMAAYARQKALERPLSMTLIPRDRWPTAYRNSAEAPTKAWESRKCLAQLYDIGAREGRTAMRLSVCRVTLQDNGHWEQNLTWEELMTVKRECGFADWYAVEIYPRDRDIVNVANLRHLWLLATPLLIGWFNSGDEVKHSDD